MNPAPPRLEQVLRRALLSLVLVCLLPSCLQSVPAAGDAKSELQRTLIYSANPVYPPYHWSVGEEQFEGASIDLLRLIVPDGVKLIPVVYPWKRALLLTGKGEIDVLVSLRITPERLQYLEFTTHRAFPNPIVVFMNKARTFHYTRWQDLAGHKGGISNGDTFGAGFDEFLAKELTVETAPSMLENFRKLQSGRIDYFVTSYYVGLAHLAQAGLEGEIERVGPPISEQDIFFGFSKRSMNRDLLPLISRRLEELDADGVPLRLLEEHLSRFRSKAQSTKLLDSKEGTK